MGRKWWRGATLLETSILFVLDAWMLFTVESYGSIKYLYLAIAALQVVTRAVGYRGTFVMTNEWFKSKKNSNMGLAYAYFLPQIFMIAVHINYNKNIPFFQSTTFSKLLMDYIFISFCMNIITLVVIGCSRSLYMSKPLSAGLLIALWVALERGLYTYHYSFHAACLLFILFTFALARYFSNCFSLGEYSIFLQAVVLLPLYMYQKLCCNLFPNQDDLQWRISVTVLFAALISCVATILIYSGACVVIGRFRFFSRGLISELLIFGLSLSVLTETLKVAISVSSLSELVVWMVHYVWRADRLFLLLTWSLVSAATLIFVFIVNKPSRHDATTIAVLRKGFHVSVILCYIPGVLVCEEFLFFASTAILWLFVTLECIRLAKFSSMSPIITSIFDSFMKVGCSTWFIVPNHFLLLLAVSLPVWLSGRMYFGDPSALQTAYRLTFLLCGVISVGIGDGAASVVGVFCGRHKIGESRKSYEGLVASFLLQLVAYMLTFHLSGGIYHFCRADVTYLLSSLFTAVLEGLTLQEDNIVLPFVAMSVLLVHSPYTVS